MLRWGAALLVALVVAGSALAAETGRDVAGTWKPPSSVNGFYKITTSQNGDEYVGRLTDPGNIVCHNAPQTNDEFWHFSQAGAFGGEPTFEGRTFIFSVDDENNCTATNVRSSFWSVADDRLRICPNSASNAEAEPHLDTQSPIDGSDRCTDFVRTTPPPQPQPHTGKDYIYKFTRDRKTCPKFGPTTYSIYLRRVEDDPANRVDVDIRRKLPHHSHFQAHWHKYRTDDGLEVNHFAVPPAGSESRVLQLPWTKKGGLWLRARVRTQSGKSYKNNRKFSPCT